MREDDPQTALVKNENGREEKAIIIERPEYSREPFPVKDRAAGVTIITIIILMALLALKVDLIYIIIASISLVVISYVIAVHKEKPSFEGMVYVLVIIGIIATAVGSTTNSGLEIYAAGMTFLLLLLFAYMTRNPLTVIPIFLYILWTFYSFFNTGHFLLSPGNIHVS